MGNWAGNVKGIIFDMDNTLLASRIDYGKMKAATHRYLAGLGVMPERMDLAAHTTGTLIAEALATGLMREEWIRGMWNLVASHEAAGMRDAKLEPGVRELLAGLHGRVVLAVVTNNARAAAEEALGRNRILRFFDCVIAREQMSALKPAPDGLLAAMRRYPDIGADQWLAVGDSWIDGKAASEAGVRFVAYRGDGEAMKRNGVSPVAVMADIRELRDMLQG
jgi:phosphoglycolate phosphatase